MSEKIRSLWWATLDNLAHVHFFYTCAAVACLVAAITGIILMLHRQSLVITLLLVCFVLASMLVYSLARNPQHEH